MAEDRPNVLVLMCDQLRFDAIRAHGNPAIATPAIDRIVESGVTARRAYTESPVCVPARTAVLTGQLPHRNGVVDNGSPLREDAPTFLSSLSAAGYFCQAIGKMHFSPVRTPHGFDRMWLSEEIPESAVEDEYLKDLIAAGRDDVYEPHGVRHELYYSPQPSQLPEPLTTTAWTGRRTVEFLDSRVGVDEPFCCWTSFIKPHPPFDPPSPWYLRYDPLRMPDPLRADEERDRLLFQVRTQHRSKWTSADMEIDRIRVMRAYYYAVVSHIDSWVGQILQALERNGQRENTILVFTADHGEYLGDHWAFGKRGFHDAAARVPFVWSWPGRIPAGRTTDALLGLTDLAPTLVAAGGGAALDTDGHDILPLLQGRVAAVREHQFGQFSDAGTGLYLCMDSEHKYVYSAPDDRELLLRVGDDTRDLAADPACGPVRDRLRGTLIDRFRADGYTTPLDSDGWRRFPPPREPGPAGDRSAGGRGRQYARWPETPQQPPDLVVS